MAEPSMGEDPTADALRSELAATRERIATYSRLVEELPALYERKFGERLQPLLESTRGLLEEQRALQDQLAALPPGGHHPPTPPALPPALEEQHPHLFLRTGGRSRAWLIAVGGGACLALLGIGLGLRRPAGPITAPPASAPAPPAATDGPKPSRTAQPGELLLTTDDLSWLEVHTLGGKRLYIGNLSEARGFPLAEGLRISAGRPDLVTVHRHGRTSRRLGSIEEIDWKIFRPEPASSGESSP